MLSDILIIGAGASGLMAARELAKNGHRVTVLEASSFPGGRINTIIHNGVALETGAEFVHGHAPVTDELLKEIGIEKEKVTGKMIPVHKGVWFGENALSQNSDLLTEKLELIDADMTIAQFLDQHFPQHEYEDLRNSVIQFAEGFSLADIQKASALTLKKEWSQMETDQFRVPGGYRRIIDHLYSQCIDAGVAFFFETAVREIVYSDGMVSCRTNASDHKASRVIITVSAGMLQSNEISIMPIPDHVNTAITQLSFGGVIKILLLFREPFWLSHDEDLGFILSDEEIPTWWTQNKDSKLLTGWLGGTKADRYANFSGTMILKEAIRALSNIFKMKETELNRLLEFHKIVCWRSHPFIKGGYSYNSIFTDEARELLKEPIHNSIYFAGEAMYTGELGGTVEAALVSGQEVAGMISGVGRASVSDVQIGLGS